MIITSRTAESVMPRTIVMTIIFSVDGRTVMILSKPLISYTIIFVIRTSEGNRLEISTLLAPGKDVIQSVSRGIISPVIYEVRVLQLSQ